MNSVSSFQGIIFIIAGFETTSNTLSTLCYNLAKHPDILDTLIEEVDSVFDNFGGDVNHETISEMPFLEACIKGEILIFYTFSERLGEKLCTENEAGF